MKKMIIYYDFPAEPQWIPLEDSIFFEKISSLVFDSHKRIFKEDYKSFCKQILKETSEVYDSDFRTRKISFSLKNEDKIDEIFAEVNSISITSKKFKELNQQIEVPFVSNLMLACKTYNSLSSSEEKEFEELFNNRVPRYIKE